MTRTHSFMDSDNDMSCNNIKMFVQTDLQIKKKKKRNTKREKWLCLRLLLFNIKIWKTTE